jgi:hypothetical protein
MDWDWGTQARNGESERKEDRGEKDEAARFI